MERNYLVMCQINYSAEYLENKWDAKHLLLEKSFF